MVKEDILSSPFVSSKTLQRFSGKVISFSLAIPDSKFQCMYARFFKTVPRHSGSSQPTVNLEANLQAEIEYWRFLDDWRIASDGELSITRPLRFIPMVQRRLGAELCTWAVTLWSPGITSWTIRRILTSSRTKLCCIGCFRLGNTLPLQEWTFPPTTASWSLPWRMKAAGAPKLTAFLKTFFVRAGNTILALMFR